MTWFVNYGLGRICFRCDRVWGLRRCVFETIRVFPSEFPEISDHLSRYIRGLSRDLYAFFIDQKNALFGIYLDQHYFLL